MGTTAMARREWNTKTKLGHERQERMATDYGDDAIREDEEWPRGSAEGACSGLTGEAEIAPFGPVAFAGFGDDLDSPSAGLGADEAVVEGGLGGPVDEHRGRLF